MKNLKIISILVLGLLAGFLLGYFTFNNQPTAAIPVPIQESITAMNNKLDTLKAENAALLSKNDSIKVKIIKIKENHEEISRTIIDNDLQSDYVFFSDYLADFDAACGFMYFDYDTPTEASQSGF